MNEPPEFATQATNVEGQKLNNFLENISNPYGATDMAVSREIRKKKISIVLFDQYRERKVIFKEVTCLINEHDQILLSELTDELKKLHIELTDALISYFDAIQDLYVFCGKDPVLKSMTIPYEVIVGDTLEIKIRIKKKNLEHLLMDEQKQKEKVEQEHDTNKPAYHQQPNQNGKNRVKERKIKEVVEKVALWRRFYTGFFDQQSKLVAYPLEDAASKVGISKKTLDDYLLQIRCGKKYGFDFNRNLNEKIGKLRSFVKGYKGVKEEKQEQN